MRGLQFVIAAVLVGIALAAAGCGGDDEEGAGTTETTATETTTTGTETTGGGPKLIGTVGSEGDPEAFEITLTTEDGSEVTNLTPGDYTLEIKDLATTHNFHLTGPGVDVSSEVGETEDENYDITLQDGTYDFVCDPHSSQMNGSFTVSG
jgi:plastocyanin